MTKNTDNAKLVTFSPAGRSRKMQNVQISSVSKFSSGNATIHLETPKGRMTIGMNGETAKQVAAALTQWVLEDAAAVKNTKIS